MKLDDPIDDQPEALMSAATISETAAPRYGYPPQAMFAATRAGAERRARETAAAVTPETASHGRTLFRRLASLLAPTAS